MRISGARYFSGQQHASNHSSVAEISHPVIPPPTRAPSTPQHIEAQKSILLVRLLGRLVGWHDQIVGARRREVPVGAKITQQRLCIQSEADVNSSIRTFLMKTVSSFSPPPRRRRSSETRLDSSQYSTATCFNFFVPLIKVPPNPL